VVFPKGGDVVGLLTITTFLMVVGYALTSPVIPLYAASFGFAAAQIGVVVAAFGFARLTFDLASGVLGDRFGFRRMALGGCVVAGVGAVVSATSRGGGSLLLGQAVSGVGSALYNAAALTAVIVHSDPRQKARTLGRYHTAMIVAFSTGPVFGGLIADLLGLRFPFLAFAFFAVLAAFLVRRNIPSTGGTDAVRVARPPLLPSLRRLLSSLPFTIALVVVASGYMIRSGVRDTAVPIFATQEFGLGASMIGLLSGVAVVSNAALLPHAGRLLDRAGRRPITIWSCAGTGAVLMLLAGVGELWQILGVMLLLGVVSAYAGLAPVASLADLIDDKYPATSVGLQRMGVDLGMVIGPLIAGVSIQYFDARVTFMIFAVFMFVVSMLSSLAPETVGKK
jgi:MFS family permease